MQNDNITEQTVKKDDETITSVREKQQREDKHASITGRPNIDEISKRNEKAAKQERISFYTTKGIIVLLLIIVVMLLVYFFS